MSPLGMSHDLLPGMCPVCRETCCQLTGGRTALGSARVPPATLEVTRRSPMKGEVGTTRQELAALIDHTYLDPKATEADIERLCQEAIQFGVAAVCVNSAWVPAAARRLGGSLVRVAATVGFPLGAAATAAKVAEAVWAAEHGAHELDMVMALGPFLAGDLAATEADIRAVRDALGPKRLLKVILETGWLSPSQIETACRVAVDAGADFVKTSTGFGAPGATVAAVRLMRQTVGSQVGVKASGGIRRWADAVAMVEAGATRLGMSGTAKVLSGADEAP